MLKTQHVNAISYYPRLSTNDCNFNKAKYGNDPFTCSGDKIEIKS